MGLPHTAVGIFTLVIMVGWLVSLLPLFGTQSPLEPIIQTATNAQNSIASSASCLGGSGVIATNNTAQVSVCSGSHWYDAIWEVFTIIFNILVLVVSFVGSLFIAMAIFVTTMLGLPIILSQIVIALLSMGAIFALIKVIIPDA